MLEVSLILSTLADYTDEMFLALFEVQRRI